MLNKIKTWIAVAVLSGTVSANVQAATVTVQEGDTLWDLSRVHNTTVENIQKWNHLTTDLIHPGDVLTIATEKHYTVKQNDTLWDIAIDHHVSVLQIKEWNNLITDLIHPGLNLIIFDGLNTTNNAVKEKQEQPAAPVPSPASANAEAAPQAPNGTAPAVKAASVSNKGSRQITVKATAYTASCAGCSGITKTGINIKANPNERVIAVDPSVIPLGSKVYVEGFGEATAADTGGAIKGNRIDVFIPSEQDALNFGVKQLKVTILN
ncbi:LysM peptidoglycan-binding and 3D domain-containing protein [Neobacillus ginsengisoli]|uniref:3D (Asp-Asp-Asp) domain-containing protein/LysM repeat protein n=1 Tax=Neobacillus ginsengisoli TaxID=904295 RepID=A0ABT9XYK5_9BACI|nr:LysM peptidoglycan-binding and 3D domain-containing protein [Neobacillus ginsengisoli]MDQ0200660.1 3D (Asp-Asp-Asp) domain-containing protein/LysM repeat protein [Neobacillus ginsengisoli]